MEDSKECTIDGLLSRTMIGTRGEAMMLNNSSRFPSRRPCCRPFALLLVGWEGEVRRVIGARASNGGERQSQGSKEPDPATSLRFNIGESGHYRSGSTPKEKLFDSAIFPLSPVVKKYSLDTLLANPTQTFLLHA